MRRDHRSIKKEANKLIADGEIADYRFGRTSNRNTIEFRVGDRWHTVSFAASNGKTYVTNFVRQQIRQKQREIIHAQI